MKTVGELITALKDLSPDMEVHLISVRASTSFEVKIYKGRSCEGPYQVCEIVELSEE